jgi:PTS system galactitol-specific IIB component
MSCSGQFKAKLKDRKKERIYLSKKRVITLCGSGIASSTICAQKIKKYCQENGVDVEVQPLAFGQLEGAKAEADLIVSVTPGVKVDTDIPVISGVPFLTGVGQQEVLKKVIEILKKEDK